MDRALIWFVEDKFSNFEVLCLLAILSLNLTWWSGFGLMFLAIVFNRLGQRAVGITETCFDRRPKG